MPFDGNPQDYTRVAPVYDRDNPPTRMSEAIRMAVADLTAIEKTPGYEIDMSVWHAKEDGACHVCFAGSVMANTLHLPKEEVHVLWWNAVDCFGPRWQSVFMALNCVREGLVELAHKCWAGDLIDQKDAPVNVGKREPVYSYNEDPVAFKRDMLALADRLEAEGS